MTDTFLVTHSGIEIDPFNPEPHQINLGDIAWALSNLCRFTGHGPFYSVAQHSVLVAKQMQYNQGIINQRVLRAGLLHDAAEAYIGDMASPIKSRLPDFRALEDNLLSIIFGRYRLPWWPLTDIIHHADMVLLVTERRDILPQGETPWKASGIYEPLKRTIVPWSSEVARTTFMDTAEELGLT